MDLRTPSNQYPQVKGLRGRWVAASLDLEGVQVEGKEYIMKMGRGMVNVGALATGVEVSTATAIKRDGRDEEAPQKKADGVPGWTLGVAVPRGRFIEEQRVTVWSEKRPDFAEGERVRFLDLAVGAYSAGSGANVYIHAGGVELADLDADALVDEVMG